MRIGGLELDDAALRGSARRRHLRDGGDQLGGSQFPPQNENGDRKGRRTQPPRTRQCPEKRSRPRTPFERVLAQLAHVDGRTLAIRPHDEFILVTHEGDSCWSPHDAEALRASSIERQRANSVVFLGASSWTLPSTSPCNSRL